MRQHEIGRLAHYIKNALFEHVEARMQIEAVRLDAHFPRDLDGSTAPTMGSVNTRGCSRSKISRCT